MGHDGKRGSCIACFKVLRLSCDPSQEREPWKSASDAGCGEWLGVRLEPKVQYCVLVSERDMVRTVNRAWNYNFDRTVSASQGTRDLVCR